MDLSKFKSSSKQNEKKEVNIITKNYYRAKYWLYPPTVDRRRERISQYKTFGLFLGSVILVVALEDKIKSFLEI